MPGGRRSLIYNGAKLIFWHRDHDHPGRPDEIPQAARTDVAACCARYPAIGAARRDGSDHVFGRYGGGFVGWSYPLSTLNLRIAGAKGKPLAAPWSLHDVRRTVRSGLAKIGIRPDVAERVIGHHRASTVEAIYDRHSYRAEIAAALGRWTKHVLAVVEGHPSTVVPMPMRA
jgi:integrase